MVKVRLEHIHVLSFGKVAGVLQAVTGLVLGFFMTILALFDTVVVEAESPGILFGVWSVFLLPVFNGVLGFLSGLLLSWMYNFFSKFVGGITLTFSDDLKLEKTIP